MKTKEDKKEKTAGTCPHKRGWCFFRHGEKRVRLEERTLRRPSLSIGTRGGGDITYSLGKDGSLNAVASKKGGEKPSECFRELGLDL